MKDDPIINCMMQTGYPSWIRKEEPICPKCREECSTIFKNSDGEIVGCDVCLTQTEAWEEEDCFPNRGRDY